MYYGPYASSSSYRVRLPSFLPLLSSLFSICRFEGSERQNERGANGINVVYRVSVTHKLQKRESLLLYMREREREKYHPID